MPPGPVIPRRMSVVPVASQTCTAGWRPDHPRSIVTTRRGVTKLTSCPTLMDVPSGSVISILPLPTVESGRGAGIASARFLNPMLAGSLINCTGTNTDGGSGLSTPRRTRLRQFHSRPPLISGYLGNACARLFRLSATTRSFSPGLQPRRRSKASRTPPC